MVSGRRVCADASMQIGFVRECVMRSDSSGEVELKCVMKFAAGLIGLNRFLRPTSGPRGCQPPSNGEDPNSVRTSAFSKQRSPLGNSAKS
jgi:hypothetical protein